MVSTTGLLALFAAAPILEAVRLTALTNTDVWWHLRTGLWMLQNHAFPHNGLFSQHSALPWRDFSWGYDVLLALACKLCGLRAIVGILMAFKLAFAVIAYRIARAAGSGFWIAALLSAVAQYVVPGMQPAPSSLSILFFGVELWLIVKSRTSGVQPLLWLPPLFLVWVNSDVQAIMGILLLLFFLAALACEEAYRTLGLDFLKIRYPSPALKKVSAIVGLSVVCTALNPYWFHIFPEFGKTLYNDIGFEYFAEMRAMSFRHPQEYLLMLLVMTAFLVLGRRRSLEAFELFVLLAGTLLAFRIQRDAWVAVLAAVAVIGGGFSREKATNRFDTRSHWQTARSTMLAAIIVFAVIFCLPSNPALLVKAGKNYPVQACDFIARQHFPQPLFNTYSWGGFITWYLPEYPVSVDGRVDLYGDELLGRYFKLISGKTRLEGDPDFALAKTLVLERQSGMTKALTDIPALSAQYRLVYSDDIADVFVRQ